MKGKQYTLNDKLTFGKYRGMTIQEVMKKDAGYIDWCKQNITGFVVIKVPTYNRNNRTSESSREPEGIDVLNINPWGYRFLRNMHNIAEDVQIVSTEQPRRICREQQLYIEFSS